MSSSYRRRRTNRRTQKAAAEPGWVSWLWEALVRPSTIGGMITIAGAVLIAAPWLNSPKKLSTTWWSAPLQNLDVLLIAMLVLAFALPLSAGLWINLQHMKKGQRPIINDIDLTTEPDEAPNTLAQKLAPFGVVLMVAGVLTGVVPWVFMQRDVLPTQAPFAVGKSTEYVTARISGRPLRLMLPQRVMISNIKMKAPQEVTLTISKPKQNDVPKQTLKARESIDVEGKRLTFVGLTEDARNLRAIIAGSTKQSIETTGRIGEKIRVTLDGEGYEVKNISRNYMGAMGPAVQLTSEKTGDFWIFERQPKPGLGKGLGNGLKVVRLETLPAAIFTVGPAVPFWPLIVAGILFVLGAGLFFGMPHALAFDGKRRRWTSLNEAGRFAEQFGVDHEDHANPTHLSMEEEE